MSPISKIRLGFGHSMIVGHKPTIIPIVGVGEKLSLEKNNTEAFGLFDTAQPNFHTYYPDVKPEDLKPKDGEFIHPIFRALSETIVRRSFDPVDFSEPGVLQGSILKLKGQAVYANHEAIVGNEVGVVSDVAWQRSYTTKNGVVVPAGINAEFKIDGKSHPNIARGIMMDPPAIHSNSVTVRFRWEKSHPKMTDDEFRMNVGKIGPDKKLVRRVVTDIHSYHETSLVAHGADPWAQKVDADGHIVNPGYAKDQEQFSESSSTPQVYYFDYKSQTESLSEIDPPLTEPVNNPKDKMKETYVKLAALAKIDTTNLSEEQIEAAIIAFINKAQETTVSSTELQANLEKEKATVLTLTDKIKELQTTVTAFQDAEKASLVAQATEVTRLYKLATASPKEEVIAGFSSADKKTLDILQDTYAQQVEAKFPATCKGCGSTEISRASANPEGDNPEPPKTKSFNELVEFNTRPGSKGVNILHPKS